MVINFNDDNFAVEALEASKTKPVLVDFFATWCGPCQMQGPIIEDTEETMGDRAVIGMLNVDGAPQTAQNFNVMSIPTLIILKDGKEVKRYTGVQMEDDLVEELDALIK